VTGAAGPALADATTPPDPGESVTVIEEPVPEMPSRAAMPTAPAVAPATLGNLATVQVLVGLQAPSRDNPSVLYSLCQAVRSDFVRSARSSRVFELRASTTPPVFQPGVMSATCSIRFLGRPSSTVLAQDLAAAAARRPSFAFTTAPDTVTGFALVTKLRRPASHRAMSDMDRLTTKHVVSNVLGCRGSGIGGRTVVTVGTLTATPAASVVAARGDIARLFGLPANAVRVVSLWSPEMVDDMCAPSPVVR
jgi:hypothetical protein